ncbi:hypothetical protein LOAG_02486 [Loa loa]|uniref:Uncharacterized protein n=1 Tax=Loa loa TaxID=7209 RepID=A0A1S0U6I8_LOALO|nr:hypothetical protein LOAG_02486 [Loa loa]EFO26001.2 hypothetical protein LOAG_02486 [Loa loa]
MSSDIRSVPLGTSYSEDSLTDSSKGWSSPFSISQCKYDSPETGIIGTSESPTTEYSDRNEKCQAIAGSMIAMDTIKASSLLVEHNLGKVERMIISSRKQPNHAGQIITNLLPDDNTQMTSQSSMLWTEKSVKTCIPTNHTTSSTTSGEGFFERDHDLSEWSNDKHYKTLNNEISKTENIKAEENHDVEVKPSNQIKQQEIASRNGPCDIHVKASRCIDLALQASTPITFILTGITTSREIRIRKLFVNGQKYVFV